MSLNVLLGDKVVFHSDSSWLYPLFELEDFLADKEFDHSKLYAVDTKIGHAAAVLFDRLGFKKVHGDLMSKLATDYCNSRGIEYSFNELVPKIACKTEDLITEDMSIDEIYVLLAERAGRK